jgi:putative transposase
MVRSMGHKRNCWDNAPSKSFFNSLKNERVHGPRYSVSAEVEADLFDYIEPFDARKRQHPTLGYASPVIFLENWIRIQHEQELAEYCQWVDRRKTERSSYSQLGSEGLA